MLSRGHRDCWDPGLQLLSFGIVSILAITASPCLLPLLSSLCVLDGGDPNAAVGIHHPIHLNRPVVVEAMCSMSTGKDDGCGQKVECQHAAAKRMCSRNYPCRWAWAGLNS